MEEHKVRWQHFRQRLRENMQAATSGRKDAIDVLRTAFWFAEIKMRLGASTAYEVEHEVEPEAFGKNKYGDRIHRNKWSKYEVGHHVPSDALVTLAEAKLPGTKRLLNHVLWKALQAAPGANENIDDWLRQLAPDIQKIVFEEDRRNLGNGSRRDSLSRRQLKMLERRAGIDALACLTIFFRNSCGRGEYPLDVGTSLYRVFLMICTTVPMCDFSLELLGIYRDRIFSQVQHDGMKFHLEDSDFLEAVDLLRNLVLSLEDNEQIGVGWNDTTQAMYKLLDGGYGFDIQFALAPLVGPEGPITNENAKDYRDLERQKRFRRWGIEQIHSSNREMLPPAELW